MEQESNDIKTRLRLVLEEKKESLERNLSRQDRLRSDLWVLYDMRKKLNYDLMKDISQIMEPLSLRDFVIKEAIVDVEECYGIIFSEEEMMQFLQIHPKTAYTINRFGLDTESSGRLHEDICQFFLGLPSVLYGHKLSDVELDVYHMHLREVASEWGFRLSDNY